MRVLLLSPYSELIEAPILRTGDDLARSNAAPDQVDFSADLVVSFEYHHILKDTVLSAVARSIVNIHISFLPWNRGADPNFWSWFDSTPKGVSIHCIDAGLDTGDILVQREIAFAERETLATSYEKMRAKAVDLFAESWPLIRVDKLPRRPQQGTGSHHRLKDKELWWAHLPAGYNTPVSIVEEMGSEHAASMAFWAKYDEEIEAARTPPYSK